MTKEKLKRANELFEQIKLIKEDLEFLEKSALSVNAEAARIKIIAHESLRCLLSYIEEEFKHL